MNSIRGNKYIYKVALLCLTIFTFFTACNCIKTEESIVVAPTCTEEGYTYYVDSNGNTVLDEFGNVKKTDIVPAKGHTPGPGATTTTPQVCVECGAILRDVRDIAGETKAAKSAGLAVNAYINAKDENGVAYCNDVNHFITTKVDTQYQGKYQKTLPYRNANGDAQNLKLSINTQDFFSHEVLSLNDVRTVDGKSLTTDSAFQVQYSFQCDPFYLSETPDFTHMKAWRDDSSKAVLNTENLRFIKYFQPNDGFNGDGYNGVYLLIDIVSSEIEVSRKTATGYERLSTLNLGDLLSAEDASLNALNGKIVLRDPGKSLFYQKGTYRFVFKYGLVWFANTTRVKDADGNDCWPWEYINDQYDSFYVTIDENANVLFPDRTKSETAENDYFYQISVLDVRVNQEDPSIIVNCVEVKNAELIFSSSKDALSFQVKTELQEETDTIVYKGKKLEKFSVSLYLRNTDLGFDEYASLDLIETSASELASAKDFVVTITKDAAIRTKSCKLSVFYTFTGEEETQQDYYFSIDW